MTKRKQRIRRSRPERTAPIRDFSGVFSQGANEKRTGAKATDGSTSGSTSGDAVNDSVRLGYSVIQDQIRRGQRIAQQMSGLPYGRTESDMGKLFTRMVNFSADFGALFTDMMETVWRNGLNGASSSEGTSPAREPSSANGGRLNVAVRLETSRPTGVSLSLGSCSDASKLRVPGLLPLSGDAPAITGIDFAADGASAQPVLTIRIDDSQPTGRYAGVVVEGESEEPVGTLSLKLSAP